ncbi:22313_t:CDS:2, partial [Entrophospora sp. SA101]
QCYGSHNSTETTPSSLYHFIVKIFTAICNGQMLGKNHFLSCDVGAVFGCDGYIDFYVDKLEWAIELLRD